MATHPLRWTTLVALARPELPAFDRVAASYADQFSGAPPLVLASATENLLTLTLGEYTAAATLVPRPIPPGQLAGPAETAWYWPTAETDLSGHAAHLLVTLVDEGGKPVEKALALTRLTAALAATAPSVGVFWGPGRIVHPPGAFVEQVATAGEHSLPLFLWVDFRIERVDGEPGASGLRLFTTGLEALGAEEIEVADYVGEPGELVGFVYNVAHYMLERRKVINDGDTIGLTDAVQVTARRGPSMLGGEFEVVQLAFERG
jgi:hypothetical protein